MIKGKFYAGLPSEMMTRSRTVDRQQTNFYWPDETDAESATPTTRAKRIGSKSITPNNNINNNSIDAITTTTQSDIKPKELVRKQLSSGIEFYDNVNAKTPESRRRRFKKIDNINLNNINNDNDFQPEKKKLETFSSKIEFYDFATENCNDSVKKSEKKEKIDKSVVGKAINVIDDNEEHRRIDGGGDNKKSGKMDSPDVGKKRISFQTTEKPVEKTKSILKNSDEKPNVDKFIVKPLPKRGLFPKNLSKSVENISKMAKNIENDEIDGNVEDSKTVEKLSTIIKEVKNLNLSNDRDSYHRETDYARRSNLDRDYDRGYSRPGYRDRYNERYLNEPPPSYPSYKYNNRYDDDYNDRGDREYMDRRNERFQRSAYSQPPPRDPYEYRTERPNGRYEKGHIRDRHSPPNYDRYDNYYDREYDASPPPRTQQPMRDVKARDVQRKSIDRYNDEEEYSACISRKPKHIPQHLRTNILFNGKVRPQAQRPMSVRNSAVTRVGVGLPDIE